MVKSIKTLMPAVAEVMSKIALNPPKTTIGFQQAKLQISAVDKLNFEFGVELQYERIAERLARTTSASKCLCAKGRVKAATKYR